MKKLLLIALCALSMSCATLSADVKASGVAANELAMDYVPKILRVLSMTFPMSTSVRVAEIVLTKDGTMGLIAVVAEDNEKNIHGTVYLAISCGDQGGKRKCVPAGIYTSYNTELNLKK